MIWLIGSKSLLGGEVARKLDEYKLDWIGSNSEVNVLNVNELNAFADSLDSTARQTGASVKNGKIPSKINWVINCAFFNDPDQNCTSALNIARTTRRIAAKLIHFSSDIVFKGDSSLAYKEADLKDGTTEKSKACAVCEDLIEKEITQYYILRLSSLYGYEKSNFISEIFSRISKSQSISVCEDLKINPISAIDAASIVIKIIESSQKASSLFGKKSALPYGVYNAGSTDEVSLTAFVRAFIQLCKKHSYIQNECKAEGVPSEELPASETKGPNAVLDVRLLSEFLKGKLPSWQESLDRFVKSGRLPKA